MSTICSVCHISSPNKLLPLFIHEGNEWKETGLSEMLERCVGKEISEKSKSEVICIRCVKQIVEIYFKENQNQSGTELPVILSNNPLSQHSCINPAKKLKLDNGSGVIHFNERVKKDFINFLPVECLAKIFMYCPAEQRLKLGLVCEKWKTASYFAWSDTKKLDLSTRNETKYSFLKNQSDIENLLLHCGQGLTEFILDDEFFFRPKYDSNFLSFIGRHCPNLVILELSIPINIVEDSLIDLFSTLNKLKSINIAFYDAETTECFAVPLFDYLSDDIEKIVISLFNYCYYQKPYHQLDKILSTFDKFKHLRQLSLWGVNISKKLTMEISQKSSLVHLKVRSCTFEDKQLLTVGNFLNLEKLVLDDSSINNFDELIKTLENTCCETLKRLDLRPNSIIDAPNGIIKFKNLEYLTIGSSNVNVTDDFIKGLTNNCQKMKYLNANLWRGMSSFALRSLSKFKHLECLNAEELSELDNEVILGIANNCKNLKHLNIFRLREISELAVKEIVKNCPKLELLDICWLNISLHTIVSIAKIVRHRKNNVVLTVKTVSNVIKRFEKLKNKSFKSPWLKLEHYDGEVDGYDVSFDSDNSTDLDEDYFNTDNNTDFDSDSTCEFY